MKQIQHRAADGSLYNAGSNFTYSYDAGGQLTGPTSQGNTTTYTFDPGWGECSVLDARMLPPMRRISRNVPSNKPGPRALSKDLLSLILRAGS